MREVALRVGSNVHYVQAATVLLEHGDQALINRVLRNEISILVAAALVEGLVKLVSAFKTATPKTRAAFFAATGTADLSTAEKRTDAAVRFGDAEAIWSDMVLPLVSIDRNKVPAA